MTDILCPVCGKPNPPEAETCQFCEAPLKTSAFIADFDEESDMPDWLRSLNSGQSAFPVSGPTEEEPDVPEWLRSTGGEPAEEQPAESPAEHAGEQPDWLTELIRPEHNEPISTDMPDWLAQQSAEPTAPFAEEEPASSSGLFGERPPEQPAGGQPPEGEPPASVPAFVFDEFEEPEKPAAPEIGREEEGQPSTLPEWLANLTPEGAKTESAGEDTELAPAELPSWLEAMRPVEADHASVPTEDLSNLTAERSGPLIGLRGVLSAEPMKIRARRAAAYSLKLRVTDEQRQRVALLEQLLADEPKPKTLPNAPVITAQYVFRLVIALALILPVLWAVASKQSLTPLPDVNAAPDVAAMYSLVQSLPEGVPVMVAFDYEAGYSGEMDAAASAVLEHLLNRNAALALVSTSATGPALAERFMANLNQQPERVNNPYTNYANLGYIPGGSVGLYSLTSSLHQTLPYDLQGVDVWATGPLSSVSELKDFGLILVLVSDPEIARAWVEQVGPNLKEGSAVLAMVASAQTSPLVQPYFAGFPRQVEGLVSGVSGGATYENITASSGPARLSWDAYTLGLLVSVFIILIGTAFDVTNRALFPAKKGK